MERTPEDIVKDIDATRERLVTNLDELGDRLQPEAIAKRQVDKVKAYYIDDVSGEIRQDRAMKTGAIALGLLILRKLLK
jgi:hypothetical protein